MADPAAPLGPRLICCFGPGLYVGEKEYKGEFYPVVKKIVKHESHPPGKH